MSKKHTWKDLPKHTWRVKTEEVDDHKVRIKQTRDTIRVDSGYMIITIDSLQEYVKTHGVEDAEFEIETEWDYGDQTTVMYMKGWRDVTEKEVREALDRLDREAMETESKQADAARRQMEALKQSNPALFEEALKAIAATKEE